MIWAHPPVATNPAPPDGTAPPLASPPPSAQALAHRDTTALPLQPIHRLPPSPAPDPDPLSPSAFPTSLSLPFTSTSYILFISSLHSSYIILTSFSFPPPSSLLLLPSSYLHPSSLLLLLLPPPTSSNVLVEVPRSTAPLALERLCP